MSDLVVSLAKRFREPSSWAGIAVLLTALGIQSDEGLMESIGYIGAGLAGLAAIFLGEKKA